MRLVDGLASIVGWDWVTLDFDGTINRPTEYKILRCSYLGRMGILAAGEKRYAIKYTGGFIRYDSLKNDSIVYSFDGSVSMLSETTFDIFEKDGLTVKGVKTYMHVPEWLLMDPRIYKE